MIAKMERIVKMILIWIVRLKIRRLKARRRLESKVKIKEESKEMNKEKCKVMNNTEYQGSG